MFDNSENYKRYMSNVEAVKCSFAFDDNLDYHRDLVGALNYLLFDYVDRFKELPTVQFFENKESADLFLAKQGLTADSLLDKFLSLPKKFR